MSKKIRTILFILIPIIILFFIVFFAIISLKKSEKKFIENGFIISNNQVTSFNKDTIYKTNLDNEISFIENENEYKISKESFIHYEDSSIQFLTNGSLLDIENINTDNTVPYYNIDTDDIIDFEDNSYILDSNKFENVLGKISDNKYIVMGNDIYLAYLDNNSNISSKVENDFYEITFQEGNIVNLSSLNFKYQTISNSIYIFVGDNIILDLGSKQICKYNDNIKECVFDITQDLNSDDSSNNSNESSGNKEQTNNTTESNNKTNNEINFETKEETDSQDGNKISNPKVILESSLVTFNSIYGVFNVIDEEDLLNNKLTITLKNTITNEIVYKNIVNKKELQELKLETLAPNSNYLLTIKGEHKKSNEEIYLFQKNFTTNSFGFSVKKELISKASITYKIDYDQSLGFDSFDFALSSESDGYQLCNEDICSEIFYENVIKTEDLKKYNLLKVSGLTPNTRYTISFDNFTKGNISLSEDYKTSITLTTLKELPSLVEDVDLKYNIGYLQWNSKNVVIDEDDSIISYVYEIYDENNGLVDTINKKSLSKIKLTNIEEDKEYKCKFILNINDNEKNISLDIGNFIFYTSDENLVKFEPIETLYYSVKGKITVEDSNENSNYLYETEEGVKVTPNENNILEITGLKPGTTTRINVKEDDFYKGYFEVITLNIPETEVIWDEEITHKPLGLELSNYGEKDNIFAYLGDVYVELTKKEDTNFIKNADVKISQVSNSQLSMEIGDFDFGNKICTIDDLTSCLEIGEYYITVVAKEKKGEEIKLIDSTRIISKDESKDFDVKLIKEDEKFVGYHVSFEGKPITSIQKNNEEIYLNENKFDFKFSELSSFGFNKGSSYRFVYEDKVSSEYYPEKESPTITLTPLLNNNEGQSNSVKYQVELTDPDGALNCDGCGLFYKFDGDDKGIEVTPDSNKIITINKSATTASNKYRIYYKADVSNLYTDLKKEILLVDSFEFSAKKVLAADIQLKNKLNDNGIVDTIDININKTNSDEIYIFLFEEDAKCMLNNNQAVCESSYYKNIECNESCTIDGLEYGKYYYLIASSDSSNGSTINNVLATYNYSENNPVYNFKKIKMLSNDVTAQQNSIIDVTPYFGNSNYLTDNYLKVDLNLVNLDNIEGNSITITLSECDDVHDNRCSSVVDIIKEKDKVEYKKYTYKFNNIKNNTRYKITVTSAKLLGEYYIYTNSDDIINIGNTEINVEETFNGQTQKSLIINYENAKNIEKINKIVYTFTNKKNNKSESYVIENPLFYKTQLNYETVFDLSKLDFSDGEYLIEISYRTEDYEVDRISDTLTYESTIYINKIEDLLELAEKVNNGDDRKDYTYVLNSDLDFKSKDSYYNADAISTIDYNNDGEFTSIMDELTTDTGFYPIGYYESKTDVWNPSDEKYFSGHFDGNNHVIYNLFINRNDSLSSGLFGAVKDAEIKDLYIKESNVSGYGKTSVLAGYAVRTKFTNIYIDSTLNDLKNPSDEKNDHFTGMIVGLGLGVNISNSIVYGEVTSKSLYTGGIAGYIRTDETSTKPNITKCTSMANIKSGTYHSGGVVGVCRNSVIQNTNYNGTINSNIGNFVIESVGGIVGQIYSYSTLQNVSSSGNLDCTDMRYCGGVVGNATGTLELKSSFSNMNISVANNKIKNTKGEKLLVYGIGGLIGKANTPTTSTISMILNDSYSLVNINISGYKNSEDYPLDGVGTLIGMIEKTEGGNKVEVKNCYSLGNINGHIKNTKGSGMIGIIGEDAVNLKNIYNGGMINDVGDSSTNGYIYGGGIPNEKSYLYSIEQMYNIKNTSDKCISNTSDECIKIYTADSTDWFEWLFEKEKQEKDSIFYKYVSPYYPYIEYRGYNNKIITSPKIKIG